MLKITITNTTTEERWTLQGRLVAPWINELKANWNREHRAAQGRRCIVNLHDVTFIDKSGARVLRSMSNQGAQFVARDVYVKRVLDRLEGKSNEVGGAALVAGLHAWHKLRRFAKIVEKGILISFRLARRRDDFASTKIVRS